MDLEKQNACWIHNGVGVPQQWRNQTNPIKFTCSQNGGRGEDSEQVLGGYLREFGI